MTNDFYYQKTGLMHQEISDTNGWLYKTLSLLINIAKESFMNSVGGVYWKVFRWMYKYIKGEHPIGADTLDSATRKISSKIREMRGQGNIKYELVKGVGGGSLVFLSGLTFTWTVIYLAIAAPLFVLLSPVLVPALITVVVLAIGFLSSVVFGVAGVSLLTWLYKYVSGGRSSSENGQKSVFVLFVAFPLVLILSPLLVPVILMLGSLCLVAGVFSGVATRMVGRKSRTHYKVGLSDSEMREQKIEGGWKGLSMT